jgi:hypothetical protein
MIFSWSDFPKRTFRPDRPKVLSVAKGIFLSGRFKPRVQETYCNFAVSAFFKRFGYDILAGKMANQIIADACTEKQFTQCTGDQAAGLANREYLVFAGLQAQPHGHVVIILPGRPLPSKWPGRFTPPCMDIGRSYVFGRPTDRAFKFDPLFFVLNEKQGG